MRKYIFWLFLLITCIVAGCDQGSGVSEVQDESVYYRSQCTNPQSLWVPNHCNGEHTYGDSYQVRTEERGFIQPSKCIRCDCINYVPHYGFSNGFSLMDTDFNIDLICQPTFQLNSHTFTKWFFFGIFNDTQWYFTRCTICKIKFYTPYTIIDNNIEYTCTNLLSDTINNHCIGKHQYILSRLSYFYHRCIYVCKECGCFTNFERIGQCCWGSITINGFSASINIDDHCANGHSFYPSGNSYDCENCSSFIFVPKRDVDY